MSKWSSNLSVLPRSSSITSQIIWCNKNILVYKKSFCNTSLADTEINHVGQLFDISGAMKPWSEFKREVSLSKNSHFYWIQLNNAIRNPWKENLYERDKNFHDFTFSRHHITKKYHIYSLSKWISKELYSIQVSLNDSKTMPQIKFFQNNEIEWKCIYFMPSCVTIDTHLHIFQFAF